MKDIHSVKPYTYLIKHKKTGKVYYGSRCQNFTKFNRTPAEDLWHYYTTSSENINNIIKAEGKDAFLCEIRKTFNSVEEMIRWETTVLRRLRVLERQHIWFNGNIAGYKILTEAGAKKISETHKDKQKTEEHKKKLSASQKGRPKNYTQTEEHKKKNSEAHRGQNNPMYGPCSEERAANISKAKKGKPSKNKGIKIKGTALENIREAVRNRKIDPDKQAAGQAKRLEKLKDYKHSEETKLKQSLAHKGKLKGPMSEEEKLKRSLKQKGVAKKAGHGDKVRLANIGNVSINKDGAEKKVKRDTLDQWLVDGWALGGKKRNVQR
jgi:hypothetical protein